VEVEGGSRVYGGGVCESGGLCFEGVLGKRTKISMCLKRGSPFRISFGAKTTARGAPRQIEKNSKKGGNMTQPLNPQKIHTMGRCLAVDQDVQVQRAKRGKKESPSPKKGKTFVHLGVLLRDGRHGNAQQISDAKEGLKKKEDRKQMRRSKRKKHPIKTKEKSR